MTKTSRRAFLGTAAAALALPRALRAGAIRVPRAECVARVIWGPLATGATLVAAAGRVWALAPLWAWEIRGGTGKAEACFDVDAEPDGDPVSGLGWWSVEAACPDAEPGEPSAWSPTPPDPVVIASRWQFGATRIAIGTVAAVGGDPIAAPVVIAAPWTIGIPGGAVFDAAGRLVAVVTRPTEDREGTALGPFVDAVPILSRDDRAGPPAPSLTRHIGVRIGFARPGHMVVREVESRVHGAILPGDAIGRIAGRTPDGRRLEIGMDASRSPMARRLLAATEGPVDLVLLRRGTEIHVQIADPPVAPARAGWI